VTIADGLRERKKVHTRRTLSAAAVQLCLERGYPHVTVGDIADAAGVSRRTFSNYFASKAECVTAFGESVLDDMIDVVSAAGQVHLDELVRHVFTRYAERLDTGLDAYFLLMQSEDDLHAAALAADSDQLARVGDALALLVGAEPGDLRTQAAAGSAALIARMVGDRWIAAGRPGGREGLIAQFTDAFAVLDLTALQRRSSDDALR
jgi:AcrR family transcriptional regulator